MTRSITLCLVFHACFLPLAADASSLTVRLYDYAKPDAAILTRAQAEASRLLADAGVELRWTACPLTMEELASNPACNTPAGPADLVIRLLSPRMKSAVSSETETFGFALVDGREMPQIASVRFGAVESLAWASDENSAYGSFHRLMPHNRYVGMLLGHVLAHEIGHLLLATNQHGRHGLMQAHWQAAAIRDAVTRRLRFEAGEKKRIQRRAARRMEAELGD